MCGPPEIMRYLYMTSRHLRHVFILELAKSLYLIFVMFRNEYMRAPCMGRLCLRHPLP